MAEVSAPPERGTAQEAVGQAQEKVQEKAQEAKQQAGGKVREQVDQRSNEAGEQVTTTASDLKTVGEELRKQGKDTPAKLADQAAERTEQLGRYLTESDADKILSDVEDFARRQPWAVVAGGLVLGFAASRFLKASSSERYSERQSRELPSGSGSGGSANGSGTHEAVAPPSPESRLVATASDEGVEIRP